MPITKEIIVQTASDLADQNGMHNVSLKVVAEHLKIRTPSLYNHITSLDEVLQEIAYVGMCTMNRQMMQAAIGVFGDVAITAVCAVYFEFMIAHPGVYETIQWATWNKHQKTLEPFHEYRSLLNTLLLSYHLDEQKNEEVVNLIMGVLHGFTTLRLGFALANPKQAQKELHQAVNIVLLGIRQTYKANESL